MVDRPQHGQHSTLLGICVTVAVVISCVSSSRIALPGNFGHFLGRDVEYAFSVV